MRHDLVFSVDIVSGFMKRPNVTHLPTVNRILRYIKGSIGCRILFLTMDMGRKWNLLNFTNFNWCEDKDGRKSTTGYIFMSGETLISCCSNKELVESSTLLFRFVPTKPCG